MSETSQEQYIYELEQALEKLLYFFDPADTGYNMTNFDETIAIDEDVAQAVIFAERTLYGYPDLD